jgi:hypothetical protein
VILLCLSSKLQSPHLVWTCVLLAQPENIAIFCNNLLQAIPILMRVSLSQETMQHPECRSNILFKTSKMWSFSQADGITFDNIGNIFGHLLQQFQLFANLLIYIFKVPVAIIQRISICYEQWSVVDSVNWHVPGAPQTRGKPTTSVMASVHYCNLLGRRNVHRAFCQ